MKPSLFFSPSDKDLEFPEELFSASKNKVRKVGYSCKRKKKRPKTYIAYRKPISPKLSRIEALYETAFGVYLGLSMTRAAENRLELDGDKLTAMASIQLPGFVPMQTIYERADPSEIRNPSRFTLLTEDAAEILTCCRIDKNWDVKYDNVNLIRGMIDHGQLFYQLTHLFNVKTIITELVEYPPLKMTEITAECIRNLPYAEGPRYWPTNKAAKPLRTYKCIDACRSLADNAPPIEYQLALLKDSKEIKKETLYLSEETGKIAYTCIAPDGKLVKNILTKIIAPSPFTLETITPLKYRLLVASSKNRHTIPHFKTQVYCYLLKKLLSFNKDVLRKRLELYLGDQPLGLKELPIETRTNLNLFPHHLFYESDDDKIERTFAEHCVLFLETQYRELLNVVVYMPEFREFLIKNPGAILEIKEWFIEQNNDKDNIACKMAPHDLAYIDREYHKIYRDSFVEPISGHLSELKSFICSLNPAIIKSYVMIDPPKNKEISHIKNIDLSKSIVMIDKLANIEPPPEIEKSEIKLSQEYKNFQRLTSFYILLHKLTMCYYQLPDPTREKNHSCIREIRELFLCDKKNQIDEAARSRFDTIAEKFKTTLDIFWMKDAELPPDLSESFMLVDNDGIPQKIGEAMEGSIKESNALVSVKPESKPPSIVIPFLGAVKNIIFYSPPSVELKQEELIERLAQLTSDWISKLDADKIKRIIEESLYEYTPYNSIFNLRAYCSTRNYEIRELQKNFRSISLLKEIFHPQKENNKEKSEHSKEKPEPGWNEKSLNTILIKNLCLNMLKYYNDEKDASKLLQKNLSFPSSEIEKIRTHVNNKLFYWKEIAKTIESNIQWDELIKAEKANDILSEKSKEVARSVGSPKKMGAN